LEDFEKALLRLEEVLKMEKTDIVRDSAIKRFEIVFDLGWKTLKAYLEEEHNAICASPKNCFQEAFHQGLIEYDEFWIKLTSLRNYAVHAYGEILAEKIYTDLPQAFSHFQKFLEVVKNQMKIN